MIEPTTLNPISLSDLILNAVALGIVVGSWFSFIGYAVGLAMSFFNDMAK